MFASRYFASRMFAPRYFPNQAAFIPPVVGVGRLGMEGVSNPYLGD